MNLQEWRARQQQGEDAELPSGLVVQIKRVSMLDLAEKGKIPATLKPKIDELMKSGQTVTVTVDQFVEFVELIILVCEACIVGPTGLQVTELPSQDRMAIFEWANEMTGGLQPFRREKAESMGVG